MKKSHIIALIALLVGIVIIVSSSKDVTTYANFSDAVKNDFKVKVAGELDKTKEVIYDPVKAPNVCSFYMIDKEGQSSKVLLKMPKPQDFELSESVVVTGKMDGDIFIADSALLKCPSKYKGEELLLRSETS